MRREAKIYSLSYAARLGMTAPGRFFDYTAYGDTINIAARLEAANKQLGCGRRNDKIYVMDLGAELFDRTWQRKHVEY